MEESKQLAAFVRELVFLIDRYEDEFDIPKEAMIGALDIQKACLIQDVIDFGQMEIDWNDLEGEEDDLI